MVVGCIVSAVDAGLLVVERTKVEENGEVEETRAAEGEEANANRAVAVSWR